MHGKRDKEFIISKLYEQDGKYCCKEACYIEVPLRYVNAGLLEIGIVCNLIGIYRLVIGDKYSVSVVPSFIRTAPYTIEEVKINEIEYYRLHYLKDYPVIENTEVLRKDILTYFIFDEFIMKGKVPWYLEYDDYGKIYDLAAKYAATGVGDNQAIIELLISYLTRQKNNLKEYARLNPLTPYKYVPLDSVYYSSPSTVNKLAGNRFSEGVVSAIVQRTNSASKVEELVRK